MVTCKHLIFPGGIENGYAKLVVIHFQNSVEHLPLVGEAGLRWRTEDVDGCVKVIAASLFRITWFLYGRTCLFMWV